MKRRKKCEGKNFDSKCCSEVFCAYLHVSLHAKKKKNSEFCSCHVVLGSVVLFLFLFVTASSAWLRSKETLLSSAHRIFHYDSITLVIILHLFGGLSRTMHIAAFLKVHITHFLLKFTVKVGMQVIPKLLVKRAYSLFLRCSN